MARRPIFVPDPNGPAPVRTEFVDFHWHSGLAISQKRKSVTSLHEAARHLLNVDRLLEVSSKSAVRLGVALSAFNLKFSAHGLNEALSVECAFQGSKVFEQGGPFSDMFTMASLDAKRDSRLQQSGRLTGFRYLGQDWSLEPQTAFYDWLYISALKMRTDLADQLPSYSGFTDIEFNPEKSINCQAYSVALFVSLKKAGVLEQVTSSKEAFLASMKSRSINNARQNDLVQGQLF